MEANYTSYSCKLPGEMADALKAYAKKINKTESEAIEEITTEFLKERIKQEIADTFKMLKGDPEQEFFAEAGLGDFLEMIEDYEKE